MGIYVLVSGLVSERLKQNLDISDIALNGFFSILTFTYLTGWTNGLKATLLKLLKWSVNWQSPNDVIL